MSTNNYENDDKIYDSVTVTDTTINKMNKNIRLGRSKDEDGVGNIWSVEPKMEVIAEEITELNKNIVTFGLIITGMLTCLPLLYILNQLTQNIE